MFEGRFVAQWHKVIAAKTTYFNSQNILAYAANL